MEQVVVRDAIGQVMGAFAHTWSKKDVEEIISTYGLPWECVMEEIDWADLEHPYLSFHNMLGDGVFKLFMEPYTLSFVDAVLEKYSGCWSYEVDPHYPFLAWSYNKGGTWSCEVSNPAGIENHPDAHVPCGVVDGIRWWPVWGTQSK